MKKHHGRKFKAGTFTMTLFGVGICFLSFLILTLIGSLVLMLTKNPALYTVPAFFAVFLTSAAISAFINAKLSGNGISGALISGGMFVIMLFIVSLIAEGGKVGFGVIVNYVCYMLVTAMFTLLAKQKKAKRRRRH